MYLREFKFFNNILHCWNISINQGILQYTNDKMPVLLQDRSMLSILGHCAANFSSKGQLQRVGSEEDEQTKYSVHDNMYDKESGNIFRGNNSRWSCGCHKLDEISERFKRPSIENGTWIQLLFDSHQSFDRKICGIPKLHHIHWHGNIVSLGDVHVCKSWLQFTASFNSLVLLLCCLISFLLWIIQVVVYETPAFGSHHFSPSFRSSTRELKTPIKKPKWVTELQQNALQNDLVKLFLMLSCAFGLRIYCLALQMQDTVILMINCAAAAKMFFDRHLVHKTSSFHYPKLYM